MSKIRIFFFVVLSVILFFPASYVPLYAIDDGFEKSQKISGNHFLIYYPPEIEISDLLQKLNIRPFDKLLVDKAIKEGFSLEEELSDMLDTLFMQVCDILDMHIYSFQANVKICTSRSQLNKIYSNLFQKELNSGSFYVSDSNTIYISAEDFRREVLGHEVAHALMSHYFVVQPSIKVQEVLAGYVEYQLRKGESRIRVLK